MKNLPTMQETLVQFLGQEDPSGEGIGYPLQHSWASLVAHMVKNPPSMLESWVRSLGWDSLEKEGMAIHPDILAWRIPMDRGAWQVPVHGVARVRHDLATKPPHLDIRKKALMSSENQVHPSQASTS